MAAAFVYHPPARALVGVNRPLAVRLDRHPTNRESAAIMGLAGYRGIERLRDGGAVVRFERFGRDPLVLRRRLVTELRALTAVPIADS